MTKETFLPEGYQISQGGGKYLKLKQGSNKLRILSNSIVWWEDRENKVVFRTKEKQEPKVVWDKPKEFWAFAAWSYKDEEITTLVVTQKTIQQAIIDLYQNPDWGDPKEYDLTINRTGEGMDGTKYTVQPSPKKDLIDKQKEVLESVEINMEVLFDGGEPITEKKSEDNLPF